MSAGPPLPQRPMRVAVVAEFYPRAHDPVLGIWTHRQAVAARAAGAEITVFVLHRVVPPRASFTATELLRLTRHPRRLERDGLPIHYLPFISPPRRPTYAFWGAFAAPALRRALRRHGPFDLVHAHNAVPPGDAARRVAPSVPLVVSVHGGDVLFTAAGRVPGGERAVRGALAAAQLVLANSEGVAALARRHGAREARVVHLGAERSPRRPRSPTPLLVTVGHLVARKRHADVVRALAWLDAEVRYLIIGDGPERERLQALASAVGVAQRVEFAGALDPARAIERAAEGWLFVMPSTDEAFGVAYVEAMATGMPAIGAAGEPGPAEIAAAGEGMLLTPAKDPPALARLIAELLADPRRLERLSEAALATVTGAFTWSRCGEQTVAAYRSVLDQAAAGP